MAKIYQWILDMHRIKFIFARCVLCCVYFLVLLFCSISLSLRGKTVDYLPLTTTLLPPKLHLHIFLSFVDVDPKPVQVINWTGRKNKISSVDAAIFVPFPHFSSSSKSSRLLIFLIFFFLVRKPGYFLQESFFCFVVLLLETTL